MPPTPNNDAPLARRVTDHREELLALMADAGRCDDIASGGYSQQYHYNSYPSHGDDDYQEPTNRSSVPPPAQPQVFADRDFQGANMRLQAGTYDLVDSNAVGNDAISSIKVPTGWKVTLYADAGFRGASKTFTSDTAYVGDDLNDRTSSIKVEQT
jgi:hypothetical protein